MLAEVKIEARQIAVAIVLLGLAAARVLWPEFALKADAIFLILVAAGLALLVLPLKNIKSLKAGGLELSLDAPHVQGAVASLNLDRIEDAKLKTGLQVLSHLLPVVTGS